MRGKGGTYVLYSPGNVPWAHPPAFRDTQPMLLLTLPLDSELCLHHAAYEYSLTQKQTRLHREILITKEGLQGGIGGHGSPESDSRKSSRTSRVRHLHAVHHTRNRVHVTRNVHVTVHVTPTGACRFLTGLLCLYRPSPVGPSHPKKKKLGAYLDVGPARDKDNPVPRATLSLSRLCIVFRPLASRQPHHGLYQRPSSAQRSRQVVSSRW